MTHSQKRHLAILLRVHDESIRKSTKYRSIFDSLGWEMRKKAITDRVHRQQESAHARAIARREAQKENLSILTRAAQRIQRFHQDRIEKKRARQQAWDLRHA